MSEEEIFEIIVKHIAEVMGLDPQYITMQDSLPDLGAMG
jgi:acyl carrier protein